MDQKPSILEPICTAHSFIFQLFCARGTAAEHDQNKLDVLRCFYIFKGSFSVVYFSMVVLFLYTFLWFSWVVPKCKIGEEYPKDKAYEMVAMINISYPGQRPANPPRSPGSPAQQTSPVFTTPAEPFTLADMLTLSRSSWRGVSQVRLAEIMKFNRGKL